MREYIHVADRVIGTPLMLLPSKAETIASVVLARQGREVIVEPVDDPTHRVGPLQEQRMLPRDHLPFLFDPESGIAIVEVAGSLAHRQGYVGAASGVMGYDGIAAAFEAAVAHPEVRAILLDIHSPGGEVAGAFQLADRVAAVRGAKPLIALADELAASAAYLIAAACDEIALASEVAQVGSVGVVTVHVSFEEMLRNEGIRPTVITAGTHKADGNPYQDLSEDVRGRIQASVDGVMGEFVSRIAIWRGLSERTVRDTEAGVFMGRAAVDAGFADGIADPVTLFDALAAEIHARPTLRVA